MTTKLPAWGLEKPIVAEPTFRIGSKSSPLFTADQLARHFFRMVYGMRGRTMLAHTTPEGANEPISLDFTDEVGLIKALLRLTASNAPEHFHIHRLTLVIPYPTGLKVIPVIVEPPLLYDDFDDAVLKYFDFATPAEQAEYAAFSEAAPKQPEPIAAAAVAKQPKKRRLAAAVKN